MKHHKILIPDSVKLALQNQVDYIALEQQEPAIAIKWLGGIIEAINSLSNLPERCAIAPENARFKKNSQIIRHLIYKKSFRIIFTIEKNEVKILSVRHGARLPLA
jgi:plasmid stabilization system protein ParE